MSSFLIPLHFKHNIQNLKSQVSGTSGPCICYLGDELFYDEKQVRPDLYSGLSFIPLSGH